MRKPIRSFSFKNEITYDVYLIKCVQTNDWYEVVTVT